MGSTLLFFKSVDCSANYLLKMFAFVLMSVTNLLPAKRIDQWVSACNNGLFNFDDDELMKCLCGMVDRRKA